MARAWRIRYAGAKYHISVRGNGRREVFHGQAYYLRFLDQLSNALEKDGVILYAYVLLPNHYHLFVETPHGNIQRFMQRLNTAYSMYHRYKHGEPGHCFQGRYGAKLVGGDDYAMRLIRYIHLNPVKIASNRRVSKERKTGQLNSYKWSSYLGYIDETAAEEMVNYDWLDVLGRKTSKGKRSAYRKYVEGCISDKDSRLIEALGESRYAIGDTAFLKEVEKDLKDVQKSKGVYGDITWPEGKTVSPEDIAVLVAEEFGVDRALLSSVNSAAREAKKVAVELSCRYSNLSQRKVGEHFGYRGNGSVLKQRVRIGELLAEDRELKRRFERIERKLADR